MSIPHPGTRFNSLAACLLLVTALSLGKALLAPFFWDDEALILYNPYLGKAQGIGIFWSPSFWKSGFFPVDYRPIEMYSYSLDHLFWRTNPFGYHATNILLHLFNCLAVYILLSLILGRKAIAGLACFLFALHPIHNETVVWIQNRSDLLSTALVFVCLITFTSFLLSPRSRSPYPVLAVLSFTLAFFAKESALVAPILCACIAFFLRDKSKRSAARCLAPLVIAAAALILVKFVLVGQSRFEENFPLREGGVIAMVFTVMKTIAIYAVLLIFPANFSLDRYFGVPIPRLLPEPLLCSAVVLLIIVISVRRFLSGKASGLALAITLTALLPVCNIIYLAGRPISEQRLYLPSLGFCLLLALSIETLAGRDRMRPAAGLLILCLSGTYLLISAKRTDCWRDERILWERTIDTSPASWRSRLFLATIYSRQERYDEAISLLKQILRTVTPRPPRAFKELGWIYGKLNLNEASMREFRRAVAASPKNVDFRICLGDALKREGRISEAVEQYQYVEQIRPTTAEGQLRLGILYKEQGDYAKALAEFEEVVDLFPDHTQARVNIASIYGHLGRHDEAENLFIKTLASDPSSGMAHNDYGLYLERRGRLDEAIAQYRKAIDLAPGEFFPHYNLAGAYLSKGERASSLVELLKSAHIRPGNERILEEMHALRRELSAENISPPLLDEIWREYYRYLNRRAIYLARTGDLDLARIYLEKLISLQPDNGEARANLGRLYAQLGDYPRAMKELLEASRRLPEDPSVHSSLGACYANLGMIPEARRAWKKALSISPHAREPRRNLMRLSALREQDFNSPR